MTMPKQTFTFPSEMVEAVEEMIGKCGSMNATQIAKLESDLRERGLDKLADIVNRQGIINAGEDEYDRELSIEWMGRKLAQSTILVEA